MGLATAAELVLATLYADDSAAPDSGSSLTRVLDQVASQDTRLHSHLKLAATIDGLVDDGLVERETDERDRTVLCLTSTGGERARDTHERLANTSVELVDCDGRRTLRLGDAADELGQSPASVAADCSAQGVYYREEAVEADDPVGRDAERDRWQAVLDRVCDRQSGECVLLSGPAGVGKTTLADDLVEATRERGLAVFSTRIDDETEPYGPIRELLDQAPGVTDRFADERQAVPDGDDYGAHQQTFHRDLLEELCPAAAEQPRLLYLDDLHLSDAATMAFFDTLLGALAERRLLVLASYRPSELDGDLPADPDDDTPVTTLALDTLDQSGTRAVVERTLDRRGAPPEFVAALHERTGGNPLFVEASIRSLVDTGQLDPAYEWYPDEPAEIDLPGPVHETVGERLAALDKGPRSVLEWAAVAGESVSVDLLLEVFDGRAQLYTALTALTEAGLFDWQDGRQAVTFNSEVVREAVLDRLDPTTKRRRHEAIADAMVHATDDGRAGDDSDTRDSTVDGQTEHATTIAAHYEAAACTDRAVEWYWRGLDAAMDVYAHEVALDCCQQILSLARESGDEQTPIEVGKRIARIYTTVGDYEQADRYVQFVRERLSGDDAHEQATVAGLAAEIANARGDYDTAIEETTAGLDRCPADSRLRCRLLAAKARAHQWQTEYDCGTETATELVDLAERVDAPRFQAKGLRWLGTIERRRGSFEEAVDTLEAGLDIATARDETDEEGLLALELGTAVRQLGDTDRARDWYKQARRAFEAISNRHQLAKVQSNLGNIAFTNHDYDEAGEYFRMAVEEFAAVGDCHHEAMTRNDLATVAYEQGEYDEAHENSLDALSIHRERDDSLHAAMAQRNLGRVARDRGAYDRAREYLRAAADDFEAADCVHYSDIPRLELARLERWVGNIDDAARLLDAVHERAVDGEDPAGLRSSYLRERAALAWRRGDHSAAAELFEEAFDELSPTEAPLARASACLYRGRFHRDRGRYEAAEVDCREALDTFESVGKPHPGARTRAALGRVMIDLCETAAGLDHLETALGSFQALGAFRDAVETYAVLVTTHWERGDRDEARVWARKAQSFLQAHELGDEQLTISVEGGPDQIRLDGVEAHLCPVRDIDTDDP